MIITSFIPAWVLWLPLGALVIFVFSVVVGNILDDPTSQDEGETTAQWLARLSDDERWDKQIPTPVDLDVCTHTPACRNQTLCLDYASE